jgi:transposase
MISDEHRAKIRRLYYGEHWRVGTIASQLGLHEDTVKSAVDLDKFAVRGRAKPSALDPYVAFMRETLQRYPRLTGTRLHEMLRLRGYEGSAGQVRRRIKTLDLRPRPAAEAYLQLQTLPGEQGQVDWGDFGLLRVGSTERRLFGFVMVLSWSRAIWAHFSFEQTMSAVVRGHVECFDELSGVPRTILYDNMKTVVLERDGDAIRFHPRFLELRSHYLFDARACRPARANEKGRVERAIRYLRSSFFAGRHFADLADVREQFAVWREEIAHTRACPQDETMTVAEAHAAEKPRLLPLPEHPVEATHLKAVVARKQPYVTYDTNRYSIPHDYIQTTLSLVASEEEIRVLHDGEIIARHPRCWQRKQVIDDRAHVEALWEYKRRGRVLKGRELVISQVPQAEAFYAKLIDNHERLAPQTTKLLELLEHYGAKVVATAIELALERGTPRADSVTYLIEKHHRRPAEDSGIRPRWGRPELDELRVQNHTLEDYDALSNTDD